MPNIVVLGNGTPPSRETLKRALQGANLFVCADGGADTARRYGFIPHAVVGDIDSATEEALAVYREIPIERDADSERTDIEKAIDWALAQGPADQVTLLGASVGRLDHVLGNLSVLRRYRRRGIQVSVEDDAMRAWLGSGEIVLDEPPGTVVSFFAVGAPAGGVTTRNLRYPLVEKRLELGVQDSISNVVEASPASIHVAQGDLVVIVNRPA